MTRRPTVLICGLVAACAASLAPAAALAQLPSDYSARSSLDYAQTMARRAAEAQRAAKDAREAQESRVSGRSPAPRPGLTEAAPGEPDSARCADVGLEAGGVPVRACRKRVEPTPNR